MPPTMTPTTRPLRAIGLAALAYTAFSAGAFAQQPRGYPAPQFPAPQYSAPQNRSPYCAQLEGQLAALDRGTADTSQSDQVKRYEDLARKQQNDLDRLTAQARRAGCQGGGFFSFFGGQPAQCTPLNAQIQQARANLDRTTSEYERLQSNVGADHETQRRSIIGALAQNDCGPQYARLANQSQSQGGGFFDRLFGPGTIINPEPDTSASNTYQTVCVRTCDGYYFPISYSTIPSKFADDEKACHALCPAADVALYSHRTNGEDISQAVSTNGRLYTELPNAFAYRKQFNPSCSCKAAGQSWADALRSLDDPTVERGDIVVNTEERAKQLSQPQTDAQGKPLRPASKGATAATPASVNGGAASDSGDDTSKRPVRAVGPTFLPAH
jgi:hypothetical protein